MRNRGESATGDYRFGLSDAYFLVNSPEAVAQAIQTRLELRTGEWYLDLTEGTPYSTQILGKGTQSLYDHAVQERILGTPGVSAITNYSSTLDSARKLSISATVLTIYSEDAITVEKAF
jgi:hypothetical protein